MKCDTTFDVFSHWDMTTKHHEKLTCGYAASNYSDRQQGEFVTTATLVQQKV